MSEINLDLKFAYFPDITKPIEELKKMTKPEKLDSEQLTNLENTYFTSVGVKPELISPKGELRDPTERIQVAYMNIMRRTLKHFFLQGPENFNKDEYELYPKQYIQAKAREILKSHDIACSVDGATLTRTEAAPDGGTDQTFTWAPESQFDQIFAFAYSRDEGDTPITDILNTELIKTMPEINKSLIASLFS